MNYKIISTFLSNILYLAIKYCIILLAFSPLLYSLLTLIAMKG